MDAISIRQARQRADLVRGSLRVDGAVVEICAFPEVREETVQMIEPQSVLMLGLSRLLTGSEGRKAGDPRRPFARMGALALRPAGVPMEFHVAQGAFDTIRVRFDDQRIAPALAAISFDDATLSACFDMHAPSIEEAMLTEDKGSIEEVARALGYAGAPSFCAAFRRETGRPPGAGRALMR